MKTKLSCALGLALLAASFTGIVPRDVEIHEAVVAG
jgi:hypothetical protein